MVSSTIIITLILIAILIALGLYFGLRSSSKDNEQRQIETLKSLPAVGTASPPELYNNEYLNKQILLRLRDFYIAAADYPYLATGASFGIPDLNILTHTIRAGPRFLAIDIHFDGKSSLDPDAIPVVRPLVLHPTAKPLKLEDVLNVIQEEAWANTEQPLILYFRQLYSPSSKSLEDKIYKLINKYLGHKLIDKRYGYSRGTPNQFVPSEDFPFSGSLGDIPIQDAINNVIIMTSVYPTESESFNEIINASTDPKDHRVRLMEYTKEHKEFGGLKGVVPNVNTVIENNRYFMSIIEMKDPETHDVLNMLDPAHNVENIDINDINKYGCQIALFHYYKQDKEFIEQQKIFANSGFVMRPDELRYIAKPKEKPTEQNINRSLGPVTASIPGIGGDPFLSFDF